jgi:hypothetical protein
MKIVETDNFDGDYPDEKFVNLPLLSQRTAENICETINLECSGDNAPRFWKVVKDDYKLRPGFEP